MKKLLFGLFIFTTTVLGLPHMSYAGGWEGAGKVLAAVEGLRILTGGEVDPIGSIFNRDRDKRYDDRRSHRHYGRKDHRKYKRQYGYHHKKPVEYCVMKKVWTPTYVTKSRYVPRAIEYDRQGQEVVIGGHYVTYKEEVGGYWKYVDRC